MANNPNDTIDQIVQLLQQLKTQLSPKVQNVQPIKNEVVTQAVPVAAASEDLSSFGALKSALANQKWPEAVNPHLICDPNSDDDKMERGRGIIELMIEENLKDLKVLDYGCGEGHCISLSADYGTSMSVGYDPNFFERWTRFQERPNLLFTNNFSDVLAHGPYDVIIMFDVIDHLTQMEPVAALQQAASALSPKGKIYMRAHPFISRHGTHLYHDLNKAYIHLVFTPEELAQLVPESKHAEPSIGVTAPVMTYQKFITDAGLKIESKRDITEKVEAFFKIPKIAERIIATTKMNNFPEYQMSLQFIDYVLKK